ncbi:hypothetical protein CHUAL_008651 [Chamberlinius hualienensis]
MTKDMIAPAAKKLWGVEDGSKQDDPKALIFGHQWRDQPWSSTPVSEHAVSQPIMVQRRSGSYPGGDMAAVLSPRSSEAGGLGMKMVEYLLSGSPPSKDLESRMSRLGLNSNDGEDKGKKDSAQSPFDKCKDQDGSSAVQSNGIMTNGLDDDKGFNRTPGSRQQSPSEEDHMTKNTSLNEMSKLVKSQEEMMQAQVTVMSQPPLSFDHHMETMGIDPIGFDYPSQLMQSMDSPNMLDYGMGPNGPFAQNSYIINPPDPYGPVGPMITGMTAPPMVQQYYGVPPWGMYSANMMQQQGPGSLSQPPNNQYPMMAPAFYDQNGSIMMGNSRGPMRLVSPASVLVNSGQPGMDGSLGNAASGMRILNSQAQHLPNPPGTMYSGNSSANQNSLYTAQSTSGIGFPQATSGLGFSSSANMGFNHSAGGQQSGGINYGSSGGNLGTIGSPSIGHLMGLGNGNPVNQRRDSLDRRDPMGFSNGLDFPRQVPKGPQYYGALGTVTASPGPLGVLPSGNQSLTPPPSRGNSVNSFSSLGALMSGNRVISAAPGAEAKCRNGSVTSNGLFGSSNSIFPHRSMQRNSSIEKNSNGRSRLLEDFRNNRYPNLQLRDLSDHIVEFSQDQHGSRFIQQKLERATPSEKQMVFNEILTAAYSLMTDVFGNYVIQKFFEFGSTEQKQTLAQKVKGHVLPLALQMYGCRVIQKALESIPPEQQKDVVKELDGHILKCVKDQNGNHVVQKCIESVEPIALQFIINAFQGQVFSLSTHPYGCRVIQRILEHCTNEQTTPILEELHQHTEKLVQDQYGNYVIQHVLEHGRPEDKSKIVAQIRGKVLPLAQHKFASNVVEKCVTHATRNERAVLIEEVCNYNDGPHSALYTMMKDQFANYVVQKMIDVAEPSQKKMLMQKIRPHVATLRKYTYGKHILAKLEKHFIKTNDLGAIGTPNPNTNGSL